MYEGVSQSRGTPNHPADHFRIETHGDLGCPIIDGNLSEPIAGSPMAHHGPETQIFGESNMMKYQLVQ